jgi:hypothetical protein
MKIESDYASIIRTDRSVQPFSRNYLGSVQLLENTGFSPFSEKSPVNSALNQVFSNFAQQNQLTTSSTALKNEFLGKNPGVRRALNTYDALEKTFAPKGPGQESAIVDFMNSKLEEDRPGSLQSPSTTTGGQTSGSDQTGSDLARDFSPLRRILDYFSNPSGNLVDLWA